MVGRKFVEILEEKDLPVRQYFFFASSRSAGSTIRFKNRDFEVIELTEANAKGKNLRYALFSAGAATSAKFAPIFARMGITVIDNSSQWRMSPDVPLVVPEVNAEDSLKHKNIIANPNCSTIQAVIPLFALHKKYGIKRVVFSTYQAVSGAGRAGCEDLANAAKEGETKKFPYPIFGNCIPQIDSFLENGYTKEEEKMIRETRKILHEPNMRITATTVRVPVQCGHSESINVEFEKPCDREGIADCLRRQPGVLVVNDDARLKYPMPIRAEGRDEVFVGRIRTDESVESGCNIWAVADNIRKGAATNAIQILEYLLSKESESE